MQEVRDRLSIGHAEYYRRHSRLLVALAAAMIARLGSVAEPGGRGIARPVHGPAARGAAATPAAPAEPFVGRGRELELGSEAYLAAAGGTGGRLLLVGGESGVGKTRLAEELGAFVVGQGGRFLRGQYGRESGAAFGAWVEALHPVLAGLPVGELARLAGPHWGLLSLVSPDVVDPAEAQPLVRQVEHGLLSPADQRQRLHDAVAHLLRNLATEQPVMLLLDDLHWAPGLELLVHVARALGSMRVLLVATHRPAEAAARGEVAAGLDDLARLATVLPVRLGPLSPEETAALARSWLADRGERLAPAVWRATGGNALLVRETLRSLAESGEEAGGATDVRLPDSARRIVLERVRRLGGRAVEVFAQAAVLGREFDYQELLALTGLDDEVLVALCEAALAAGILVDRADGARERYRFRDDHVADALYESASAPRLRRWHLRAGEVLEARAKPAPPERTAELARHFARAGDPDRGGTYSFLAGQDAERVYAWGAAIGHYRAAARLWQDAPGYAAERAELSRRLGTLIYHTATDVAEGIAALRRALELYEELGDVAGQVQVHTWLGLEHAASANLLVRDQGKAEEHLQAARRLAGESGAAVDLCNLLLTHALARTFKLDVAGVLTAAGQARQVAEQSGDAAASSQADAILGIALVGRGRIAEGRALLDRAGATAAGAGLAWHEEFAALMRIWTDLLLKPRRVFAQANRPFQPSTKFSKVDVPTHLVGACAYAGELERGAAAIAELTAELERQGQPTFGSAPEHLGRFLARAGEWDRSEALLGAALAWARDSGDAAHVAMVQTARGELLLFREEHAAAHEALEEAARLFREGGAVALLLDPLALQAQCLVAMDRLAEAERLIEDARGYLAAPEDWGRLAAGFPLAEGLLLARRGAWSAAAARVDEALEVYRGLELGWDEAWALFRWGAAAFASDDRRTAASAALSAARERWAGMGAGRFAEQAGRLLRERRLTVDRR